MHSRNLMLLGIFALSLLFGAGFWIWMNFTGDRSPRVHDMSISPETYRFAGGIAQVQAKVSDDQAVKQVMAVLVSGDNEVLRVDLVQSGLEGDRQVYQGEFQVPANVRSDGESNEYTLHVLAVDSTGQESTKDKRIKVPAPNMPPAPPD